MHLCRTQVPQLTCKSKWVGEPDQFMPDKCRFGASVVYCLPTELLFCLPTVFLFYCCLPTPTEPQNLICCTHVPATSGLPAAEGEKKSGDEMKAFRNFLSGCCDSALDIKQLSQPAINHPRFKRRQEGNDSDNWQGPVQQSKPIHNLCGDTDCKKFETSPVWKL